MILDERIKNQKYESKLIDLIKDNYVILITSSQYKKAIKSYETLRKNRML